MPSSRALLSIGLVLAAMATSFGSAAAPKKKPKPAPAPKDDAAAAPFDRQAAASVLAGVDLGKCKTTNAPRGEGHVMVRFAPGGSATEATVDRGPMAGTPTAKCIATQFKKAKVPAFTGDAVQVGKSFRFE